LADTLDAADRCAILHVEDEDGSACLFRAALKVAGINVSLYRVSDGEQALAFLHQAGIYRSAKRPALVVLDLNMPRVDGWTVLTRIAGKEQFEDVPIVVLSTSRQSEDQTRALALGARRYFVKTDDFIDLVRAVESICTDFLPQAVS
jgi:CheY-like chemotaxis protein